MEWTFTHFWVALALGLGLAELITGAFILLALGLSSALTALASFFGVSISGQLICMGLFSGIFLPLVVFYIRPYFSPKAIAYGTTGSGAEQGKLFSVTVRKFDGACGIMVNGDFYRIEDLDSEASHLPEGSLVLLERFEGTTALIHSTTQRKD